MGPGYAPPYGADSQTGSPHAPFLATAPTNSARSVAKKKREKENTHTHPEGCLRLQHTRERLHKHTDTGTDTDTDTDTRHRRRHRHNRRVMWTATRASERVAQETPNASASARHGTANAQTSQ
eukprot:3911246-Rhodomonas_salina.5